MITNSKPPIIMAKIERHRFFMDSPDSFLVLDKLGPQRIQTGSPPRSVCSRTDGRLNLTRPTLRWCVVKTPTLSMLFIMLSGRTAWQSQGFLEMLTAWPWLIHESLNAIGWHFFQLVAQPLSEVVQDAQLRCFIVQQCVERRFGLACVGVNRAPYDAQAQKGGYCPTGSRGLL